MSDADTGVMPENRDGCKAHLIALQAHAGQLYNGLPYVQTHCAAVVQVVKDFGFADPFISAAWLHDVMEDTSVTYDEIALSCGTEVADMVGACTGVGSNRNTRNMAIYDKIAFCPTAAVVKVADRIANVEASARWSKHRKRYVKESVAFQLFIGMLAPEEMCERLIEAYLR